MPDIGELGEQLVAEWLQTQGWAILHYRWRCRWGEIDLIARQEETGRVGDGEQRREGESENSLTNLQKNRQLHPSLSPSPIVAFVEVKTRSRGNWDADGLLAITPSKQAKLWQAAELFLSERPELANLPCRFDVALVNCQRISHRLPRNHTGSSPLPGAIDKARKIPPIKLGQPVLVAGYQLILQQYIQSAFD